ncbi:acyl carrier protein [Liquorilactobacillus nagelii]|uniref:acyl carrier protein n=1 Tax=Liquorilactobacillus nagelii TaxID=82688 RepID=UPI0039ED6C05
MTEKEIFNKLAKIIHERFEIEVDQITPNLNFTTDLDADSIDLVEFVLELEDSFGAEIPDEEAEKLQKVQDVVDYIKKYQK